MYAVSISLIIIAAFAGSIGTWLVLNKKLKQDLAIAGERFQSESKLFEERLNSKEKENSDLKVQLQKITENASHLHTTIQSETERRASAETKGNRIPELETNLKELHEQNSDLRQDIAEKTARMEEEKKNAAEKIQLLEDTQNRLSDSFKSMSAEALKNNNRTFLDLAKENLEKLQNHAKNDLDNRHKSITEFVKPIKDSLNRVDEKLQTLETKRESAYSSLIQQVKTLGSTQDNLKSETTKLVQALRSPIVRGRWGEIQLKRVVEIAGMLPYCDFVEQNSVNTDNGRLRPDVIVKFPGNKNVVVDAKAPLNAYLDSLEVQDEESRKRLMKQHALQVKKHIRQLSSKSYWDQFHPTPEFVVMFLPGEAFFSAALEMDPTLIEEGANLQVMIASPTTLITLLRTVAFGWKQEQIAENANEIGNLGKNLYERIITFTNHFEKVGKGLLTAVDSYNKATGSLESRVLTSARKFKSLGTTSKDIPLLKPMEKTVVLPQVIEAELTFEERDFQSEQN